MVCNLVTAAAKISRRLDGENQLPQLIQGVTAIAGLEVIKTPATNAG